MTDQSPREKSLQPQSGDGVAKKPVRAQIPQAYEMTLDFRVVPGHRLKTPLSQPHCEPRGNRQDWSLSRPTIDPQVLATLAKADEQMIKWLAEDTANVHRFLAAPVAAMRDAGVKLPRAIEKSLARASAEASAARTIGPGVTVVAVQAKAFPKGRVGSIGSTTPGDSTEDFDCGPKRKG